MAEYSIPYTLTTPAGVLSFNPTPGNVDGLYLTEVAGLDGGDVRSSIEPRPQRDGAIVFDAYRGAAYPTLTCYVRASDVATRQVLQDQLRVFTESIRTADGDLQWLPSGATHTGSGAATLSGSEITDNVRTRAIDGDGRSAESSIGFWQPATNLIPNGGCELTTYGWTSVQGATLSRANAGAKFGTGCLQVTTAGLTTIEGCAQHLASNVDQFTTYTLSVRVFGTSGQMRLAAQELAHGVAGLSTLSPIATLNNTWQRLTVTVTPAAGTDTISLRVRTTTLQAITFLVDGAQAEPGVAARLKPGVGRVPNANGCARPGGR
jgi:hypothetical protein